MRFTYSLATAATALVLSFVATAPASAAITMKDAEIPQAINITISDVDAPGVNGTFVLGEMVFTDTTNKTWEAFCADLFNEIGLGSGQNMQYNLGAVGTDNNGHVLSADTLGHMAYIADVGFDSSQAYVQQAAQAAFWRVEYGSHFVWSVSDSSVTTLANQLIASSNRSAPGQFLELQSVGHASQNFWTPGGVPEPSSWALMLIGFGGLGGMLRHRRSQRMFAI
jgi:hypothetical protein